LTLTALEKQVQHLEEQVNKWEEAGLRGCNIAHECRTMISMINVFQSQVKRAIALVREGKGPEAIKELGDYVIIQ